MQEGLKSLVRELDSLVGTSPDAFKEVMRGKPKDFFWKEAY